MANQQPDARTALATRAETQDQPQPAGLPARIAALEQAFQLAMPRGLEAKRLIRDAQTCLRTIPNLDKCDPDSVLGALMTCAQLGLRPGVLGHAWPLPYWDGRTQGYRAQLVIGYQGLIELGHRSGQISSLIARVVHTNDTFDVDYGLADSLIHKPNLRTDRGEPIAYYAIAKFVGGGHAFIVMTQQDMIGHRDRYAPRNKDKRIVGPWVDNFEAMALKTVIRQLAKYMPKSTDLAEAVAADGGLRVNVDPHTPASDVTGSAGMWDGHVIDDRTDPPAQLPPAAASEPEPAVKAKPERTEHDRLLQQLHIHRNKLEGFAGTSEDAKALFLVHVASVIGHEVTSTKELTEDELHTLIDDLKRAKREQDARARHTATERPLSTVAAEQSATMRTLTNPNPELPPTEDETGY